MTPELHLTGLAAAMLALAYFAIYPRLPDKSLRNILKIDLVLSVITLLIAGSAYFGSGTGFSLIVTEVPWWVFLLLVSMAMEIPLFTWFCRRWNIDPFDDGA